MGCGGSGTGAQCGAIGANSSRCHWQTWRRFESCSTLEELLLFARSLPCTPLGKLHLVNVTMSPHVTLDLQSQLGLTLQRLDLWPAGHIRVEAA